MRRGIAALAMGLLLALPSIGLAEEAKAKQNGNGDEKANAQQKTDESVKTETTVTEEKVTEKESPKSPGYGGDIWKRSKLTGDWGGLRDDLAAKGITLDVNVTQATLGNMRGGANTHNAFAYTGSTDYTLTLNTEKMGLWKGGTILLNAESAWGSHHGKGIQPDVGSLLPVNLDAYKPAYGKGCITTLSEYIYFQSLFDNKLVLIAGKLDGSRAFDRNAFANDERTQFMNLAFRNNPLIGAFAPYTNMGAGFVLNLTDWLTTTTAVVDAQGRATTTGFETAFHGPTHTSIIHEWDAHVKPFGLDGNQRVGFLWSSMEADNLMPITPFKQTGPALYNAIGPKWFNKIAKLLPYKQSPDNVGLYYNFDQYVYQEKDDPSQGIGLFGRFGWARQDVNALTHFYSLGVGGKGILPDRDKDTFGTGYYFSDLSNDLPYWFHSEQGIEAYYSIEITPWLHISPDMQIIMNPGGSDERDCAFVYGMRCQINL